MDNDKFNVMKSDRPSTPTPHEVKRAFWIVQDNLKSENLVVNQTEQHVHYHHSSLGKDERPRGNQAMSNRLSPTLLGQDHVMSIPVNYNPDASFTQPLTAKPSLLSLPYTFSAGLSGPPILEAKLNMLKPDQTLSNNKNSYSVNALPTISNLVNQVQPSSPISFRPSQLLSPLNLVVNHEIQLKQPPSHDPLALSSIEPFRIPLSSTSSTTPPLNVNLQKQQAIPNKIERKNDRIGAMKRQAVPNQVIENAQMSTVSNSSEASNIGKKTAQPNIKPGSYGNDNENIKKSYISNIPVPRYPYVGSSNLNQSKSNKSVILTCSTKLYPNTFISDLPVSKDLPKKKPRSMKQVNLSPNTKTPSNISLLETSKFELQPKLNSENTSDQNHSLSFGDSERLKMKEIKTFTTRSQLSSSAVTEKSGTYNRKKRNPSMTTTKKLPKVVDDQLEDVHDADVFPYQAIKVNRRKSKVDGNDNASDKASPLNDGSLQSRTKLMPTYSTPQTCVSSGLRRSCNTGYVYDPVLMLHENPMNDHPEQPNRIRCIHDRFGALGLLHKVILFPLREATREELSLIHDSAYLDWFDRTSEAEPEEFIKLSIFYNQWTVDCAKLCCGGVLNLAEQILTGTVQNGLAIVRPPGHHAERHCAMGFCFYNNVAIVAKHIQRFALDNHQSSKRILIVDWDIHHGNGTQNAFYSDPSVLYISLHRFEHGKFFPSKADADMTFVGNGHGLGKNINIPWSDAEMGDAEYIAAFYRIIMPIANEFCPDFVIVSCGFDAAEGDPLGGYHLSPSVFAHMTFLLKSLAGGRLLMVLEGGYCLGALQDCATSVLKTLLGEPLTPLSASAATNSSLVPNLFASSTMEQVIFIHKKYWKCLAGQSPLELMSPPMTLMDIQAQLKLNMVMVERLKELKKLDKLDERLCLFELFDFFILFWKSYLQEKFFMVMLPVDLDEYEYKQRKRNNHDNPYDTCSKPPHTNIKLAPTPSESKFSIFASPDIMDPDHNVLVVLFHPDGFIGSSPAAERFSSYVFPTCNSNFDPECFPSPMVRHHSTPFIIPYGAYIERACGLNFTVLDVTCSPLMGSPSVASTQLNGDNDSAIPADSYHVGLYIYDNYLKHVLNKKIVIIAFADATEYVTDLVRRKSDLGERVQLVVLFPNNTKRNHFDPPSSLSINKQTWFKVYTRVIYPSLTERGKVLPFSETGTFLSSGVLLPSSDPTAILGCMDIVFEHINVIEKYLLRKQIIGPAEAKNPPRSQSASSKGTNVALDRIKFDKIDTQSLAFSPSADASTQDLSEDRTDILSSKNEAHEDSESGMILEMNKNLLASSYSEDAPMLISAVVCPFTFASAST